MHSPCVDIVWDLNAQKLVFAGVRCFATALEVAKCMQSLKEVSAGYYIEPLNSHNHVGHDMLSSQLAAWVATRMGITLELVITIVHINAMKLHFRRCKALQ